MKKATNSLNNSKSQIDFYNIFSSAYNSNVAQIMNSTDQAVYSKKLLLEHIQELKNDIHEKNVLLIAENSYTWCVIFFACLTSGKKLFVLEPNADKSYYQKMITQICPEVIISDNEIENPYGRWINVSDIEHNSNGTTSTKDNEYIEGNIILFTTGTTGVSKGVELSFKQILVNALSINEILKIDYNDNVLLFSPFYRAMGMILLVLGIIWGGKCVITKNQIEMVSELTRVNPTIVNFPPVYLSVLKKSDKYIKILKRCKAVIVGSAGISDQIYNFYHENEIKLYNGYGMTECVSAIALSDFCKSNDARKLYPLSCCNITISACGEILVKGETVAESYLNGDRILDDKGWYHTGDIGVLNGETIEVIGRKDSVHVLKNGIKLDLASIKKRILTDEYIMDCKLEIEQVGESEILCAHLLVKKGSFSSNSDVYKRLNMALDRFERIKKFDYKEV